MPAQEDYTEYPELPETIQISLEILANLIYLARHSECGSEEQLRYLTLAEEELASLRTKIAAKLLPKAG